MSANQRIGENVHLLLRRRGISGAKAAKEIGIDPGTMSRKLLGRYPFRLEELLALSAWLDVPVGDLFEGVPTR